MLYIAIHRFLGGLQEVNHFFPPKASQVNFGGSLVMTCLSTKKGCLCVQEATEGLCTPGSQRRRYTEIGASWQKGVPTWVGDAEGYV